MRENILRPPFSEWLCLTSAVALVLAVSFLSVDASALLNNQHNTKVDDAIMNAVEHNGYVTAMVALEDVSALTYPADATRHARAAIYADRKRSNLGNQRTVISRLLPNGSSILRSSAIGRWFVANISKNTVEVLRKEPSVAFIYQDKPVHTLLAESAPLINADDVWEYSIDGTKISGAGETICVIDSGVDYNHADLDGTILDQFCYCSATDYGSGGCCHNNMSQGYDAMDDRGHGTHVAGIAAGNGTLKGIAPGAHIISIKVADVSGSAFDTDIANAVTWCTENMTQYNISVITISLGSGIYDYPDYCDMLTPGPELIEAHNQGIFVSVASGNNGSDEGIAKPACVSTVTSVGATYKDADYYTSYSNVDEILDLLAPGGDRDVMIEEPWDEIVAAFSPNVQNNDGLCFIDLENDGVCDDDGLAVNQSYIRARGTSMAAPHVAGAAALMIQYEKMVKNYTLTPDEIEQRLKETGDIVHGESGAMAFPRIDVTAALFPIDVSNLQRQYAARDLNIFGFRIKNGFNNQTRNVSWSFYNGTDTVKSSVNLSIQPKNTTLVYFANNYTDADVYFINASAASGDLNDEETMTVWVGDIIARDLQEVGAQGKNKTYRFRIRNNMNASKVVNWTLTIQGVAEIQSGHLITLAAGEEMLVAAGYNFGAGSAGNYNVQARAFSGTLSDNTKIIVSNVP